MKTTENIITEQLKIPSFFRLIAAEIQEAEVFLGEQLQGENETIAEAAHSLLNSGGKRLRPGLLLLAGHCGPYKKETLIPMAAAVEMIHMASLIHDDIVDDTPLRRGKPTAAKAYGKATALYTGNVMLAKALRAVLAQDDPAIRKIALTTATEMCRGEFDQQQAIQNNDLSKSDYLKRIRRKTANLMAAACEIGARAGGATEKDIAAMTTFGENLGMAFQITDDILDYIADESTFGKATGSDIREGLATIPLICTAENTGEKEALSRLLKQSRESKAAAAELLRRVKAEDGTAKAAALAGEYLETAKAALKELSREEVRKACLELADFIEKRRR